MKVKSLQVRLDPDHLNADLESVSSFLEKNKIKRVASHFLEGRQPAWSLLLFFEDGKIATENGSKVVLEHPDLNEDDQRILEALRLWRQDKARELNVPGYLICSNEALMGVVRSRPATTVDLQKVKGFGKQRITKHGSDIIALLNSM